MANRARVLAPITLAAVSIGAALSLARVFETGKFVLPVVGAAVLAHGVGAIGRRWRWPTALVMGISILALVGYVVFALEPSTTTYGLPLGDTWETIGRHLSNGWHTLRATPAPAPATSGAVLLAVVATWVMATVADWLAFTRQAVLGALAPALVLFVWSSFLGTKENWEIGTAAFAVLAGCFLYEQNLSLLDRRRSWLVTRGAARAPSIVPTAIVAAAALFIALVLAPAIPGAGADPVLDLDNTGGSRAAGSSGSYEASVPPLVDVGDKLEDVEVPDLFTVRSPRPDYWRITALDEYTAAGGGQWTLQAEGSGKVEVGLSEEVPDDAVRQVYDIRQLGERWIPAAFRPVSISLEDLLVVVSSTTLVTNEKSVQGLHYTVESQLGPTEAEISDAAQAATSGAVPPELRQFRALPADFPVAITSLAENIVKAAGATTPYAKAKALRDYFRSGAFVYDTSVDLGDSASAIEEFLRIKRGFCVQFASAYSVMARAVGLPTRLAVGYTSGTRSGDTYTVGSHDAHAWPEVWLAGLGWTHVFDPTPGNATAGVGVGGSSLQGEEVAAAPTVTTAPPATTTPPVATTPAAPPQNDPAATGGVGGGVTPSTAAPVAPTISTTAPSDNSVWEIVGLVMLAVLLLGGAYAALVITAKRRRRTRRHHGDPAVAVQGAWDEALDRLREARLRADPALTPIEFARVTPAHTTAEAAAPMRALARTYTTSRYSDLPPAADDARAAWDSVEELERALTASLSRRERWRRVLDPSTLRVPTHSGRR